MILAYHRPETLEQALALLGREQPLTLPLGGGRILSRPEGLRETALAAEGQVFEVVDVQRLGLEKIETTARGLTVGAATRLLDLAAALDAQQSVAAPELARVIRSEFNPNLAAAATTAGALVSASGRSPYAAAMLALETTWEVAGAHDQQTVPTSDLLALRRETLRGRLITAANLSLAAGLAYEAVARTPADRPLVFAVTARWSSGRTRIVIGGWGTAPVLALDGPDAGGAALAASQAASHSGDAWASADYRGEMAAVLVGRCLARLGA